MVVRIRFARIGGRRNLPHFNIVVANNRARRDAKPLETLGSYSPVPDQQGIKHVRLNMDRTRYWVSVGAQPSESVARLLAKAGILPTPPRATAPTPSRSTSEQPNST
ncbi:uncharacterized protein VTP21DRAFT_9212 [Calcarisporiella thermophila]|uniref:uncharacterized protein n=1 Tax=Calcarisporiella thermophila TaxID=911321 RepID=UPI0037421C59